MPVPTSTPDRSGVSQPGYGPRRTVAVLTGTRAEYGLLAPVLRGLDAEPVDVALIVTGTHLSRAHGHTVDEIRRDGREPAVELPLPLADDSPRGIARSVAVATEGVAAALLDLHCDLLVVLGDRYEVLAAAQAALLVGVPIAHIHGGELTEGAIDEHIRHAVTKLASLHFVAAPSYRDRVVQMGEAPERVHLVGALALDTIAALSAPDAAAVARALGWPAPRPFFLVTWHPETLDRGDPLPAVDAMFDALAEFPDHAVVVTATNADACGALVAERIAERVGALGDGAVSRASLGHTLYLRAMQVAAAVVGNSSSGVIEAPAVGTPTVNIGERQKGRLRAPSVIDVPAQSAAIVDGLRRALGRERERYRGFGDGTAGAQIARVLATVDLASLARKPFYDLPARPPAG